MSCASSQSPSPDASRRLRLAWLAAASAIALTGFAVDLRNSVRYGGADFRSLVVGARMLAEGRDPYFTKWQPADGERLCDPNDDSTIPTTRVAWPPAVLLLFRPMAGLSYGALRLGWTVVQWVLLVAAIALLAGVAVSPNRRAAIWVLGLLLISGSWHWRMHVERGQVYVLYAFLMAAAYRVLGQEGPRAALWSGALTGFAAVLRPPLVLLLVPAVIFRSWRYVTGGLVGVILTAGLSLLCAGPVTWGQWFHLVVSAQGPKHTLSQRLETLNVHYPSRIEGLTNLSDHCNFPAFGWTVEGALERLAGVPEAQSTRLAAAILLLCLIAILWVLRRRSGGRMSPHGLFLAGATLVVLSGYFTPIMSVYSNVLWLVPLGLIAARGDLRGQAASPMILLLAGGLLFAPYFSVWLPHSGVAGQYLMLAYLLWAMLREAR